MVFIIFWFFLYFYSKWLQYLPLHETNMDTQDWSAYVQLVLIVSFSIPTMVCIYVIKIYHFSGWCGTQPSCNYSGPTLSLHAVPYSEHSSFTELLAMVSLLRPRLLIPTVGNGSVKQAAALTSHFMRMITWLMAKN